MDKRTLLQGIFIIKHRTLYKVLLEIINEKNDEKLLSFSHRAKGGV